MKTRSQKTSAKKTPDSPTKTASPPLPIESASKQIKKPTQSPTPVKSGKGTKSVGPESRERKGERRDVQIEAEVNYDSVLIN
jgi:hypothetical protein